MKAVVLKRNGVLEIEERLTPIPGPNECLVKIRCAGICSSDISRSFENGSYGYPLVMGHELSGEVISKGVDVINFKAGQRVAIFPLKPCFNCQSCKKGEFAQCSSYDYYGSRCDGGYSEFLSVNEWNLLPIPDNVLFRDAALLEPMSVVVHALRRAEINEKFSLKGGRVAIIGAGFLGLIAIKILKHQYPNIEVAVFDRNLFKVNIANKCGAIATVLSDEDAWRKYLEKISCGYDVVIEATGVPESYSHSIKLASNSGCVVWMGNPTADIFLQKTIVSSILRKEIRIMGTWNSFFKSPVDDDWITALDLLSSGISPSSLVTHHGSIDEIPIFLERLYLHKAAKTRFDHVKLVIENA